jgi:hypothetical protein
MNKKRKEEKTQRRPINRKETKDRFEAIATDDGGETTTTRQEQLTESKARRHSI